MPTEPLLVRVHEGVGGPWPQPGKGLGCSDTTLTFSQQGALPG